MIANLGFPIVISVYLLVRIENRMENLTESIQSLTRAISEMK
ncbi:MAG: YvrJ family protein [Clostridiales bacterium]|nr:YvrJ family protein [Clostridiales bacterium]